MSKHKIKIAIFSLILLLCLTTLYLAINLNDAASMVDSPNIEFSSNARPLRSTIKAEEITTTHTDILKTKVIIEEKTTQQTQMIVMPRPYWKFDERLINQLETLKSAAANGDNEAGYILAMNLRYCFHGPIDDIALEEALEQAYEFSDSGRAVSIITERYEYCAGIGQKQRNQFYSYSEAAANNGYVPAQEIIGKITAEFFMDSQGYKDLEREQYIQIRDNFIEQKIYFLEQAAQNGSLRALTRLSNMYHSQNFGENGHVKSFALNQLILELTQNNKTYNRYSRYQQKQHSQLTSVEIDNAFTMYEEWLEIIRAKGTLYLERN